MIVVCVDKCHLLTVYPPWSVLDGCGTYLQINCFGVCYPAHAYTLTGASWGSVTGHNPKATVVYHLEQFNEVPSLISINNIFFFLSFPHFPDIELYCLCCEHFIVAEFVFYDSSQI